MREDEPFPHLTTPVGPTSLPRNAKDPRLVTQNMALELTAEFAVMEVLHLLYQWSPKDRRFCWGMDVDEKLACELRKSVVEKVVYGR